MRVSNRGHRGNLLLRQSGNLLIIGRVFPANDRAVPGRSNIQQFSRGSEMRMRRYLRECRANYRVLITLTYPYPHGRDGEESKNHLRRFCQELRRYSERRECTKDWSVFWFMEFQENGAIHYHLLSTAKYPKEWIARTWYRIVGSDDPRHLRAGTRIESIRSGRGGMQKYVAKYAAKQTQKKPPESMGWVGRFWGVVGERSRMAASISATPDQERNPRVRKTLKLIKDGIKRRAAQGRMKKLKQTNEFFTVYVIKTPADQREIAEMLSILEVDLLLTTDRRPSWLEFELNPEPWELPVCQ